MHAFPKSVRLRQAQEFKRTMDAGSKVVCPLVVLFGTPTPATDGRVRPGRTRIGLVVSRKVGNSVVRNRVKRHLREAFRQMQPEIDGAGTLRGIDVVVLARFGAAQADSAHMAGALRHCLQRLGRAVQTPPPAAASPPPTEVP